MLLNKGGSVNYFLRINWLFVSDYFTW